PCAMLALDLAEDLGGAGRAAPRRSRSLSRSPSRSPRARAALARHSFQARRARTTLSPDDCETDAQDDSPLERRLSVLDSGSRPPRNSTGGSFSQRGHRHGVERALGRTLFRRQRDYIVDCWRAFCSSSALHGLRYVTRSHLTAVERGFWGVCIIVCIVLSLLYIDMVYKRWDGAPPVLSVPSLAPTWEVPFPAVSICPAHKITYSCRLDSEEAGPDALAGRDATLLQRSDFPPRNWTILLTESARPKPTVINLGFKVCYDQIGGTRDVDRCVKIMREKSPALSDIVLSASWNGIPLNLSQEAFPTIVSDGGLCYTFNMLDTRDIFTKDAIYLYRGGKDSDALRWTLERGYPRGFPWESVPRRALRISPKSGLYFTMRGKNSFKLVLHAPMDLPIVGSAFHNYAFTSKDEAAVQSARQFELIPMADEETVINVSPELTESSDLLQSVDVERRQCYFLNERRLRYFQVYTQRNCEMECLANHTVAACHCAAIFMPMAKHHRVCESRDCYLTVMKGSVNCSCLPSCTTLEYKTFVSHYNWKREYTREGLNVQDAW
ncbi:Pickpocket protein 28, partial [Frankliniella fusca]